MMQNYIEKQHQQYHKLSDLGSYLGASFFSVPTPACLFGALVFRTSAGHPLDRFWRPWGHPWSDFPNSLNELRSHFF